jgi:Thioredoxin
MNTTYETSQPSRADVDAIAEPVVIEFGTSWCGHCIAAQPLIETAFAEYPALAGALISRQIVADADFHGGRAGSGASGAPGERWRNWRCFAPDCQCLNLCCGDLSAQSL